MLFELQIMSQIYIGETQQWFPSRRYQHQYAAKKKTQTDGIAQHVTKTKHQIDWENTIFLDSETNWRRRKIKEALYIDSLNPGKQISNKIMNLEKGFDISGCWKEFSSDTPQTTLLVERHSVIFGSE